jgi:hypothetical protein
MSYQPPDYGGYERQKADVNYNYGTQSVQNAYGRFISQQRGSRSLGDLSRNFGRQMPSYKANFAQRGLAGGGIKSGAYKNSMNRFVGDYSRDYLRGQQDMTQELQGYDLNQANLDEWRQQSLAGIEAQKAREIADTAASLEAIRQIVGGL